MTRTTTKTGAVDPKLVEALLAAKQEVLPAANPEIFNKGIGVFMLAGPRPWVIERWVREIASVTKLPVDWSYSGGRAVIQALVANNDEHERLAREIDRLLPSLREAARLAKARGDEAAYELTT